MQNRLVPHPCVVDTSSGGISLEWGTCSKTYSTRFQYQEEKSPQLLAAKTSRD